MDASFHFLQCGSVSNADSDSKHLVNACMLRMLSPAGAGFEVSRLHLLIYELASFQTRKENASKHFREPLTDRRL